MDIDDLYILSTLLDSSIPLTDIAKTLRITPPALSHRLKKYRENLPNFQFNCKTNSQEKRFSPEAEMFCIKARQALGILGFNNNNDTNDEDIKVA